MAINSLNIARSFDTIKSFNNKFDKSKEADPNDLSKKVTEKYEPGESRNKPLELSINLKPQYSTSAPVSKTNTSSEGIFETIIYQDIAEKVFSENESNVEITKSSNIINSASDVENIKEIKTGFYLTIPDKDLQKLSRYVKNNETNISLYKAANKTKKGVIVNLTA